MLFFRWITSTVTFTLLLLSVISSANARTFSEVSFHTGTEVQNDLRWHSISYGRSVENLDATNPLPRVVHRFINHKKVSVGLGINMSRAHIKQFQRSHYDISVIPSLRYTFNSQTYIDGGVGVAYNDLEDEESENIRLRLGSKWFFAPRITLGFVLTRQSRPLILEMAYGHRSNGGLTEPNSGLDFFTLGLGMRF